MMAVVAFFGTPIVASAFARNPAEVTVLLWGVESVLSAFVAVRFGDASGRTEGLARLQYRPAGPSALEDGVAEARETLDAQIENLNDLDTKAIRILRINVLLIGAILSALTFSAKTKNVSFEGFLNVYFGAGIFLLLSSTATAGLTYTASDSRVGMSKPDFETMLREDLTEDELNLVLTKSYAKWIHDNQTTEVLNSFYSTSTILLLVYAATYLALGVYDALIRDVSFLLEGSSNVALFAITMFSGYPSQVRRVLDALDFRTWDGE